MQDATSKQASGEAKARRPYEKPVVCDEEIFERATLLGASGTCGGEVGICGTAENPNPPAK